MKSIADEGIRKSDSTANDVTAAEEPPVDGAANDGPRDNSFAVVRTADHGTPSSSTRPDTGCIIRPTAKNVSNVQFSTEARDDGFCGRRKTNEVGVPESGFKYYVGSLGCCYKAVAVKRFLSTGRVGRFFFFLFNKVFFFCLNFNFSYFNRALLKLTKYIE